MAGIELDSREEAANVLTHGAGAVASVVAAVVLITRAQDLRAVIASAVFGAALVLLYAASTLYHAARSPRLRARLRVVDHASIYVLIAGTYTPFTLLGLRGGWGWSLFGVAWGLAIAGIVFKLFFTGRFDRVSTLLYVLMGWLVVIAIVPLQQRLSGSVLTWLVAGGLAYTGGTAFYLAPRRYAHAAWHVCVLAGSACHVAAAVLQLGSS